MCIWSQKESVYIQSYHLHCRRRYYSKFTYVILVNLYMRVRWEMEKISVFMFFLRKAWMRAWKCVRARFFQKYNSYSKLIYFGPNTNLKAYKQVVEKFSDEIRKSKLKKNFFWKFFFKKKIFRIFRKNSSFSKNPQISNAIIIMSF